MFFIQRLLSLMKLATIQIPTFFFSRLLVKKIGYFWHDSRQQVFLVLCVRYSCWSASASKNMLFFPPHTPYTLRNVVLQPIDWMTRRRRWTLISSTLPSSILYGFFTWKFSDVEKAWEFCWNWNSILFLLCLSLQFTPTQASNSTAEKVGSLLN